MHSVGSGINCDFHNPDKQCPTCGYRLRPQDPPTINRNCAVKMVSVNQPCTHLGECVETRGCQSCIGTTKIKVFACSIHGLCSIGRDVGEHVCQSCTEYTPPAPSPTPPARAPS